MANACFVLSCVHNNFNARCRSSSSLQLRQMCFMVFILFYFPRTIGSASGKTHNRRRRRRRQNSAKWNTGLLACHCLKLHSRAKRESLPARLPVHWPQSRNYRIYETIRVGFLAKLIFNVQKHWPTAKWTAPSCKTKDYVQSVYMSPFSRPPSYKQDT